jgi:hypothetical protein
MPVVFAFLALHDHDSRTECAGRGGAVDAKEIERKEG